MSDINDALKHAGGGLLAIGILLLGATGMKVGSNSLADSIPKNLQLDTWGIGFVLLGAMLLAFAFQRRVRAARRVVVPSSDTCDAAIRAEQTIPRATPDPEVAQERVCLKPVWPQRETPHWIGGLPKLPASTAWPLLNGRPAAFQAQLALADLPDTLWHGLGPRQGWLVVFADDIDCVVMRVDGPVTERAQPDGVRHQWSHDTLEDGLDFVIGDRAAVPPRWFLDLDDAATLGAVEDLEAEIEAAWEAQNPRFDENSVSRSKVAFKAAHAPAFKNGSTWLTPKAILAALRQTLEKNAKYLEREIRDQDMRIARLEAEIDDLRDQASGQDDAALEALKAIHEKRRVISVRQKAHPENIAALQVLEHRLGQLPALAFEVRATEEQGAYDASVGADLHSFVAGIKAELARVSSARPLSAFDDALADFTEALARRAYCTDTGSVPPELLECLAPLWQQQVEETSIFLGTNADLGYSGNRSIRLIDLPSSSLTGTCFGDWSRFYADIPVAAFEAGDFSQIESLNTHGM